MLYGESRNFERKEEVEIIVKTCVKCGCFYLRDEFTDGGEHIPSVQIIEERHQDPEIHVGHADQDAHLHLDAVHVGQLGLTTVPHGINSEDVGQLPVGPGDVPAEVAAVARVDDAAGHDERRGV